MAGLSGPPRRILITGASSAGKSTLVAELARRGHATVPEPGRRIVERELQRGGGALPWSDPTAFAQAALNLARQDLARAQDLPGPVFFDRGLIDAAAALERAGGPPAQATLAAEPRYHESVILAPPWPEIYVQDPERRHGLDAALVEYTHLAQLLPALGYRVVVLEKGSVAARADAVVGAL